MCKDSELGQDVSFDFTKHVDLSADAIKAIQVHTLTETLGAFKTSLYSDCFEDVMVWRKNTACLETKYVVIVVVVVVLDFGCTYNLLKPRLLGCLKTCVKLTHV